MNKLVKMLGALVMSLLFVCSFDSMDVKALEVREDGSIDVKLCEGDYFLIEHPGEEWVIHSSCDAGLEITNIPTYYESTYCSARAGMTSTTGVESSSIIYKPGAATYKVDGYMHQYWFEFKSLTTGKIQRYYCSIYDKIEEIRFSDDYVNANGPIGITPGEIYMYEGDAISMSALAYNSDPVNACTDVTIKGVATTEPVSDPNGPGFIYEKTNNISFDRLENGLYVLSAIKEGNYELTVGAYNDSNGTLYYTAGEHQPLFQSSTNYQERMLVKVRKRPVVTMPSDVYMKVNSNKDIVCDIKGLTSLEGVNVAWDTVNATLISNKADLNKLTVTSGSVTGTVNITATYTDDVINDSPKYEPRILTCKLHIEDEKLDIKTSTGTDILASGVVLNGASMSTAINCSTGAGAITNVSTLNEGVAKVTYTNGVLTINRVATGTTKVVITTRTGSTYEFPVTINADAAVLKAVNPSGAVISWSKAFGAVSYDVYRCDKIDGVYTKIGNTSKLTYTDTTSTFGKAYYYKVVTVAADAKNNSGYSNAVKCTRIPSTPSVSGIVTSNGQYRVTLKCNTKCDGYVVYVGKSKNPTNVGAISDSLNATISVADGTWYIRVRGYVVVNGTNVYSEYSDNYTFKTADAKIGTTKVKKATRKGKKIKLTLKKTKGASGYQIKYSTSKKFKKKSTVTKLISKNKVTLKKIKKTKTYYIKARAYKVVNGNKVWGKWCKVKKVKK